MIKLIVAVSENRVIGKDNDIPWKQKADMKNFKQLTTNNIVVMGARTYDSLGGKPLKNRTNIIITSNIDRYTSIPEDHHHPVVFSSTFEYGIDTARRFAESEKQDIFIIGGSKIYQQALDNNIVDKILLTKIRTVIDGDRFFPTLDKSWQVIDVVNFPADSDNQYPYSFFRYTKT